MGTKRDILRVPATLEDIKKSYAKISGLYATLEGRFEKRLRDRGLELLSVREGEVVLEIGFGTGYALMEIACSVGEMGKAYGIDITPQMLEQTRKRLDKVSLMGRVELCEGDARNMPYEDDMFDAVYMASTLELFDTPDIPRVLSEIKRVLRSRGRLVVASMSKKGQEDSRFLRFYEWLHHKIPRYASCRPIYVEESVGEARFHIVGSEELLLGRLVPMRIITATPSPEGS